MDTRRRCGSAGQMAGATIASALLVMLTSCAHEKSRPAVGATTTTSARMMMNDDAAMRVARARCQHEKGCGHVGSGERFADDKACTRAMFDEAWDVVRDETCPNGVDEARLATCVTEARSQPCGEERVNLDAIASCRTATLCTAP